ncbi:MAG: hypothetical protein HY891_06795 [Deltaproteobacteria bacterium]|nr:hypothetical protein [Deltaproteobacteria bacterium]
MNTRNLEIHRLKTEGVCTTTELAKIFKVTPQRISTICDEVEHEKKMTGNSYFLMELPINIRCELRRKYNGESNATIKNVAELNPLELRRIKGIGEKNLKKTKDVLLQYKVNHLMHENWGKI